MDVLFSFVCTQYFCDAYFILCLQWGNLFYFRFVLFEKCNFCLFSEEGTKPAADAKDGSQKKL